MDTRGLGPHTRASQLCVLAEGGTVTERRRHHARALR